MQVLTQQMIDDFYLKDKALSALYDTVSPYTFYETLFIDLDLYSDEVLVTFGKDTDLSLCQHNPVQGTVRSMVLTEAIEKSQGYANVYIAPCTFFHKWNNSSCLKDLYAIVVDFDGDKNGVSLRLLEWLIKQIQADSPEFPAPTFICNSGQGLHLFWCFDRPVPMFSDNKRLMKELYAAVHSRLMSWDAKPQRHHIAQAYRIVGSATKLNTTSTAYKVGSSYDVQYLLDCFGVTGSVLWGYEPRDKAERKPSDAMIKLANCFTKELGVVCTDMNSWDSVHAFIKENKKDFDEAVALKKNTKKQSKHFNKKEGSGWGSREWYNWTKTEIIQKTPDGNRYSSLMALMVIAYKCNIPFSEVKKDEEEIILKWQMRPTPFPHRFNDDYIDRVDNLYSEQFKKTTRKQLEQWLGFSMGQRSIKKNGRPQALHLKGARAIQAINDEANGTNWRDGNGRKSAKNVVKEWRKEHPTGKKADCVRDTGLSKPTVYKWWDATAHIVVDQNIAQWDDDMRPVPRKLSDADKQKMADVQSGFATTHDKLAAKYEAIEAQLEATRRKMEELQAQLDALKKPQQEKK